ncbi:precorrin-6A reductase [Lachnospiraceae bacterium AM23-2LB]|nr:precorrin-6A reductase [Lachnospiraceae bacterium AM23-2LB]RJW04265.1 precorrin-6A reductase [Lachnospiraceae bacterium AM40-2BH]
MEQILVFSGTTEGNALVRALRAYPVHVYVSVATEYGEASAAVCENTEVVRGRMDREQMQSFLREKQITLVIDATHPFARIVTENIREACRAEAVAYIRCLRESREPAEGCVFVESIAEAVTYLKETTGNILLTTGSKELQEYTRLKEFRSRCYARVLSTKEAVEKSIGLGFEGKHLLAMQGPFSKEMNKAMIAHVDAKYVVTKETGKAGGFPEKLEAAKENGACLVVIRRPEEDGKKAEEIIAWFRKHL